MWSFWVLCFLISGVNLQARPRTDTRPKTADDQAASYVDLGNKFARSGDPIRAISAYNVAIDFSETYAPAYFRRGAANAERGNLAAAEADYTKALELRPRVAEVFAARAFVRGMMKDAEHAFA